ncbi:hypothetical protein GCM10007898_17930 [Dyella flagellata]|uniref:PH domain-containing protein n=1 Tax=Dyella flagellata TaxID=1867833 RepID=A0ABQ5XAE1_9GAMM|nr:hypothetical protein GCM10007898_17930 [Dyella flagellata]
MAPTVSLSTSTRAESARWIRAIMDEAWRWGETVTLQGDEGWVNSLGCGWFTRLPLMGQRQKTPML